MLNHICGTIANKNKPKNKKKFFINNLIDNVKPPF